MIRRLLVALAALAFVPVAAYSAPPQPAYVTGSPVTGAIAKASGPQSLTTGDLSGDCSTAGSLAVVCAKASTSQFGIVKPDGTTITAIGGVLSAVGGGGGSGGDLVKIGSVVTTGSQTTVTFSAIPNTYSHLAVKFMARGTATGSTVVYTIRFNGDTSASYYRNQENRYGSSQAVAQTSIDRAGIIAAASAPANLASPGYLEIPGYAQTTFYKEVLSRVGVNESNTIAGLYEERGTGYWENTAAISSITFGLASGAFVDGSMFTLYGLK